MPDHRALRLALRLNAGFSTISAIAILFLSATLSELMGIPAEILIAIAIGLIAFAAYLVFTANRSDVAKLRRESRQHSIADFAWVAGTGVVVALGLVTPVGDLILAVVAVFVLALGVAQWRGLSSGEAGAVGANVGQA